MINVKKIKSGWKLFVKQLKDKDEWKEVSDRKGLILKLSAFTIVYLAGLFSVGLIVLLFFVKNFFKGDLIYFGQVTNVAFEPVIYFMMGGFAWGFVCYAIYRGWIS